MGKERLASDESAKGPSKKITVIGLILAIPVLRSRHTWLLL